jgi:hypothetical protein
MKNVKAAMLRAGSAKENDSFLVCLYARRPTGAGVHG